MTIFQAFVHKLVKEAAGFFETQQPTVGCWNQTLLEVACLDDVKPVYGFATFSDSDLLACAEVQNLTILPYGLHC